MNYEAVNLARNTLGLDEYATIEEIKSAYRNLANKLHPDKCQGDAKPEYEKRFKQIVDARDTLFNYCSNYRYSFKEKDVERSMMDDELRNHLKRYYDGWWGNLDL